MNDDLFRTAQLRLCFESMPQAQFAAIVNGSFLYIFLNGAVDRALIGTWLAALLGLAAIRLFSAMKFRRNNQPQSQSRAWELIALIGALLAGLLWGSAGWFLFVADSIFHQAFLAFVIGGMAAGAVTTLSAQLVGAQLFIILSVAPLTLRFAHAEHEFGSTMSAMLLFFMTMMLIAAARYFRNFHASRQEILRRESAERELEKIAYYDPLTDLPNRRLFADHLQRAIASARRQGTRLAVCYLDLDHFKRINDQFGRDTGDRVLVRAGATLAASVRAGDVVAHWGGDEFALLLTNIDNAEACEVALKRLVKTVATPHSIDGAVHQLSASIGATLSSENHLEPDDPDTLLRQADYAMYLVKNAGRTGFHLFDALNDAHHDHVTACSLELARALEHNELVLHFQPKVEMDRGLVYGAEALVRWQHPERGLLQPGAFLPQWETDKSMIELDRWVLKSAIGQLDQWLNFGLRLVLSVNVSAWLLHDEHFTQYLGGLLDAHPRVRGMLELEVTETRALNDVGHICEVMAACAQMDVQFALDDFGTGFSSLVHLQRLPANILKIDTTFVRAMLEHENDRILVKGIISLGQALGKEVVAEGVETPAHGEALLEFGCRCAQGYGIAKPMPAAALTDWVSRYQAPASWLRYRKAAPAAIRRQMAAQYTAGSPVCFIDSRAAN